MGDQDPLVGAITPSIHTAFLGASDGVVEGRDVTLRAMQRRGWVSRSSRRNPWRLTLTGWAMRRALEDRGESFALLREAHRIVQLQANGPSTTLTKASRAWLKRHAEWKKEQ